MLRSLVGSEMCIRDRYQFCKILKSSAMREDKVWCQAYQLVSPGSSSVLEACHAICAELAKDPAIGSAAPAVLNPTAAKSPVVIYIGLSTEELVRCEEQALASTSVLDALATARNESELVRSCLLYTSDAADEEDSGDIGGRRHLTNKKKC
eukprot:TRINITY_DN61601_c0_g1_i1.p1 TRINITY_DN61601_c0_g1~~TRINITY_DN61601_c0_g1_i1.p1  ORF type:complete len:151 (+),score=43.51 TRINITY_DN61601_c0_g1_i1:115-567(+)